MLSRLAFPHVHALSEVFLSMLYAYRIGALKHTQGSLHLHSCISNAFRSNGVAFFTKRRFVFGMTGSVGVS